MTIRDDKRFLSKVSPCPITGCWWWTAGVDKDGYGKFQTGPSGNQKHWRAHRWAYERWIGRLSRNRVLRHLCNAGSGGCVNPIHLKPGTPKQNRLDCVANGRHAFGERIGAAKLTVSTVQSIRETYRLGKATYATLAEKYDVSKATIAAAVTYRLWSHVP